MKNILVVLLAVLCVFTFCVPALANEAESEASEEPTGFMGNLKYMGLGMLGIFIVIGVVIAITYILNSVTGKKKND